MRNIFLAIMLFGFVQPSLATTQPSREQVEALLLLNDYDKMAAMMYDQMRQIYTQRAESSNENPEARKITAEYMGKILSLAQNALSWDVIKDDMIDIYLNHYTSKEIEDMLAFYQSESGRSMTKKMPAVMTDIMQVTTQKTRALDTQVKTLVQEMMQKLSQLEESNGARQQTSPQDSP